MSKNKVVVGVPAPSEKIEVSNSFIAIPIVNSRPFSNINTQVNLNNDDLNNDEEQYVDDYYSKQCILQCKIFISLLICTGISIFLLIGLLLGANNVNKNEKNDETEVYNVSVIMTCLIVLILSIVVCLVSLNKHDTFTQNGLVGYYQRRHRNSSHR